MRIVHIEDFFHPDAGYQVNILSKYQAIQGNEVTIVTMTIETAPDFLLDFFGGDRIDEKDIDFTEKTGVRIIRVPAYAYISGRSLYKSRIYRIIDDINPDILYVHGNDTYIGIRYALKLGRLKYPIVFDSHMLAAASKNRFNKAFYWFYRTFIAKRIIRYHVPVIRTVNDDYVQRNLGIPAEQCPIVGFGSDLLLFHRDDLVKAQMREEMKIPHDAFVVTYAGKLDEFKGGMFLAESIREKIAAPKQLVFLIIGNCVGAYGEKVSKMLQSSENRVVLLPTQKYVDLAKYYKMTDLVIFPKACSLSFFDAQACGVPVIAENGININVDRLSNSNGLCFEADSMEDFRAKIYEIANLDEEEYERMARSSAEYVSKNYNYQDQVDLYNEIIKKQINTFIKK